MLAPLALRSRRALLALVAVAALIPVAAAQAPATLSHQGYLTDAEGEPLSGNFVLNFRLYAAAQSGTALWSEAVGLEVSEGVFHALLGLTEPLDLLPFDAPYWLGVAVNNGDELAPRLPLSAVPYSRRSGHAETSTRSDSSSAALTAAQAETAAQADVALGVEDGALSLSAFDASAGSDGQVLAINGGQVQWSDPATEGVDGVTSTARSGDFVVLVNRDNRIGSEWFGVRAPVTVDGQYGGMYVETNGTGVTSSRPFYGYAHNGFATGWHEINGSNNNWQLIIGNALRFRVEGATGDVYADGTFNSGGADLAEAFDVTGPTAAYGPGDVLVIAPDADRTLALSAEPYATTVAGVYATQPGVLLSEAGVAGMGADQVPVGVMGVVPTKVSGEGGPIRRGDLLVSSSTPGHAMRADPDRLGFGMVIGKALEPFDGAGTGRVQVLVNVK